MEALKIEAKAEIETHPLIAETKTSDCSMQFKAVKTRKAFSLSYHFGLFL